MSLKNLKRIKIIGDGSGAGTKIIDCDTGEAMEFVQKVEFTIEKGCRTSLAAITMLARVVEVDVGANAVVAEGDQELIGSEGGK